MKKRHFWLGILISLIALSWALKGIHWNDFSSALQAINYAWFIPVLCLMFISIWCRAIRWKFFFVSTHQLSTLRFFNITNVGYLVNNLFPFRVGELVRIYLMGELENISKAHVLSTVLIERAMDTLILLLLLALSIPYVPVIPEIVRQSSVMIGILVSCLMVLLIILAHHKDKTMLKLRHLCSFVPYLNHEKFYKKIGALLDGLDVLSSLRLGLQTILLSLFIWLLYTFLAYFMFLAFNLQLPFVAAIFMVSVSSLGIALPSSPGYIGVYHSFIIFSLSLFSVDKSLALSYALVFHGWQYIFLTLLGGIGLWKEGISYAHFNEVEKQAESKS
jgi:glycosyltransferase 2 family protein